jgi:PST family polysaccharide transporter
MIRLIKKIYHMVPREESKVVLENFFSLSGLQGINYILPLLFLPYLIRVVGPEKFGLIAFAQAFVQYFMIFTDYGFSLSATKEISLFREKHEKICSIFSAVMIVKIALSIVSFLILALILRFVPKFHKDWMVYVFSFGTVIGNTLFPIWFYQGTERMKYIVGFNVIGGLIFTVCVFTFVKGPSDYLLIPLINSIASLATGISALYLVLRKFCVTFVFQTYDDIRQQLKAGWNIFYSIVAINAYTTTRIFAVGLLTNNTLTGYYSIAEKIANIVQTFPLASFSQALYPRISKTFLKNKKKAFEIMYKIQSVATNGFLISLPIIFVLSPWIIYIVCGKKYPEAILALRLLIVPILFVGANAYKVQFLLVAGETKSYARIHIMMATLGLPLIFLSIYYFSYAGAALATILIEAGILTLTTQKITELKVKFL